MCQCVIDRAKSDGARDQLKSWVLHIETGQLVVEDKKYAKLGAKVNGCHNQEFRDFHSFSYDLISIYHPLDANADSFEKVRM